MEAYCERRGLTIAARYQEVGHGWFKKRPEFQRMLADARRDRFDTIVCWKSDRLSGHVPSSRACRGATHSQTLDNGPHRRLAYGLIDNQRTLRTGTPGGSRGPSGVPTSVTC